MPFGNLMRSMNRPSVSSDGPATPDAADASERWV